MNGVLSVTNEYPQLLVVSTTRINRQTATGSAMRNFFFGWPIDRIAQLHCEPGDVDTEVCKRYFSLSDADVAADGGLSDSLVEWLNDFGPDVIYFRTIDKPVYFQRLGVLVADATGARLVTHTMDDWVGRLEAAAIGDDGLAAAKQGAAALAEAINTADHNLTISDPMATAMTKAYGGRFTTFHNAIDLNEWSGVSRRRSVDDDGVFRVRYTGSLAADMCLSSAIDLCYVVDMLRLEGRNICLEMTGGIWWERAFNEHIRDNYPSSSHLGMLDRADYLQFLADADLAILPINFDGHSLSYVQYSMSNKGPEYMAAGVPVLAYGPEASATIDYASRAGWATCVLHPSPDEAGRVLRRLMDKPDERAALGAAANRVGRDAHDAVPNRDRLRQVLAGS